MKTMTNKKICGLSLPDEINEYIRQRAEQEHRSLANVVAMMVIKYYNMTKLNINYKEKENN